MKSEMMWGGENQPSQERGRDRNHQDSDSSTLLGKSSLGLGYREALWGASAAFFLHTTQSSPSSLSLLMPLCCEVMGGSWCAEHSFTFKSSSQARLEPSGCCHLCNLRQALTFSLSLSLLISNMGLTYPAHGTVK